MSEITLDEQTINKWEPTTEQAIGCWGCKKELSVAIFFKSVPGAICIQKCHVMCYSFQKINAKSSKLLFAFKNYSCNFISCQNAICSTILFYFLLDLYCIWNI